MILSFSYCTCIIIEFFTFIEICFECTNLNPHCVHELRKRCFKLRCISFYYYYYINIYRHITDVYLDVYRCIHVFMHSCIFMYSCILHHVFFMYHAFSCNIFLLILLLFFPFLYYHFPYYLKLFQFSYLPSTSQ